jgi:hypothetical protein
MSPIGIDAQLAADVFAMLYRDCAGLIELRALTPSGATPRCFAPLGDPALTQFLAQHADANLYLGVATRRDATSGALANCQHLPALFVDVDYKTTPEAEARTRLTQCPVAPSLIVSSGGGLHSYWLLREPMELPEEAEQAKALLRRLAAYLGGDRAAAEPARILGVAGTWNAKYDPPRFVRVEQRRSALRYNPTDFESWLPAEPADMGPRQPFSMPERVTAGSRNDTLYRLTRSLHARGLSPDAVGAAVATENQTKCAPPLPADEVAAILAHAGTQPHDATWRAAAPTTNGTAPHPAPSAGAVVTCLATVAPEAVAWLWPARVARGKLTVLAGDPGLGKSFVTLDMAARTSTGRPWPDGAAAVRGVVILLSAEDGPADTIRPRVDALGGDCTRIHLVQAIREAGTERAVSLDRDLPALEHTIATLRPALVVIDPATAYLGASDSYKDADVRRLLAPLARLADKHHVAVLSVMHLTKNSQTRALYRTGGSIGFIAAARVALVVGQDPNDPGRRILTASKNNLAALPPALAYRITEDPPGTGARVVWDPDPVADGLDADALLAGSADDPAERRDADGLLRELLADGEQPVTELLKAARANRVSERTLDRAKRRLGIKARHIGRPGTHGAWYWYFPDAETPAAKDATATPKGATSTRVAPFGEPSERTDETSRTSPKGATSPNVAPFGGTLPGSPPPPGEERL